MAYGKSYNHILLYTEIVKLLKCITVMLSDYTNEKANVAGPGVYKAMLLLSMAFILKLITTIFTFGIKV